MHTVVCPRIAIRFNLRNHHCLHILGILTTIKMISKQAFVFVSLVTYVTCAVVDKRSSPGAGSAGREFEGVVEAYLLARDAAQQELDEFYSTAEPGALTDPNTNIMSELRYWLEQLSQTDLLPEHLADLVSGDPGLQTETPKPQVERSARKRSITRSSRSRWSKAIVPYLYTDQVDANGRNEIQRAMQTYQRFTCVRFVLWENDTQGVTTNEKLQLGHPGHLKFVAEGGCWSYVGNLRTSRGQTISCCGWTACIHELGHMFGEYHEQQSPSPDRSRFIRINYDNIQTNAHRWYQQASGSHVKNTGYDLNSPMHYATWMFGNGNGPTFARLFPELHERGGFYYLMSEVSTEHGCPAQCSETAMVCENDGYLTKVDGQCACRCIPGLDPNTGCSTILKADPPGLEFPGGKWAIPAHESGCPDGSFLTGSRTQVNSDVAARVDFRLKCHLNFSTGYFSTIRQQLTVKMISSNDLTVVCYATWLILIENAFQTHDSKLT
ncbi:hypothetical protein RRG08_021948 [Elysia crispata]|uniref:Metalloendopeptidase n=1 Tax=Elysia crispata TaxID=231223 RepID=A0AAE1ACL9_9GAST|nr:hypothetical protein RRG08_021948 [Elysia crispata]